MGKENRVVRVDATIRQDQRNLLEEYTKTWGHVSLSQTLRVVIDEWKAARERDLQAAHMTN